MIEIIPSILTNDPSEAKELLNKCEGVVERVQIDIIDGVFAANKTVDPSLFNDYEGSLKFDFHLMVKDPVDWIEKCLHAGADRIIGQIEKMSSQADFVINVMESGVDVGLALDLKTPASELDKQVIKDLDVMLVMSVPAGFGGQKFDPKIEKKIAELDHIKAMNNLNFKIQDDGGITFSNIDDVHVIGVNEVVIGRLLFEGSLADNINEFQQAAHRLEI